MNLDGSANNNTLPLGSAVDSANSAGQNYNPESTSSTLIYPPNLESTTASNHGIDSTKQVQPVESSAPVIDYSGYASSSPYQSVAWSSSAYLPTPNLLSSSYIPQVTSVATASFPQQLPYSSSVPIIVPPTSTSSSSVNHYPSTPSVASSNVWNVPSSTSNPVIQSSSEFQQFSTPVALTTPYPTSSSVVSLSSSTEIWQPSQIETTTQLIEDIWSSLWQPALDTNVATSLTSSTSTPIPSSTMVIRKSSLPGRSALNEQLSYLAVQSSSTSSTSNFTQLMTSSIYYNPIMNSNTPVSISSNTISPSSSTLFSPTTTSVPSSSPTLSSSSSSSTSSDLLSTIVKLSSSTLSSSTIYFQSSSSQPSSTFYTTSSSKTSSSIIPQTRTSSSLSSSSTFNPLYSTYTQEYYFTGEETSFSTGIPITLNVSPSTTILSPNPTSLGPLTTQAVITAPLSIYEKWLNGGGLDQTEQSNNDESTSSTTTNKGTIAGSVVGAVAGLILCGAIVWFLIFKRRKNHQFSKKGLILNQYNYRNDDGDNEQGNNSFSHGIGYKMRYESTNNGQPIGNQSNNSSLSNNPFKHEFEFDKRQYPSYDNNNILAPPVPAPRKIGQQYNSNNNDNTVPKLAPLNNSTNNNNYNNNNNDNYHLRFSYVSTETGTSYDSSAMGSYSTISSVPNRNGGPGTVTDNDRQGFLREIL